MTELIKNIRVKIRVPIIASLVLLLLGTGACTSKKTLFEEVDGKDLGVDFVNGVGQNEVFNILTFEHLYNGGGVAIDDFNNDGLQDLFFTGNLVDNKLFLNTGDLNFKDISETAGIEAKKRWCSGVSTVDINRDGLVDIYVNATLYGSEGSRKNMLFINKGANEDGIPVFEEQAAAYGIDDDGFSTQSVFFDFDHDDDLDLYVLTNRLEVRSPNKFYFKRKDGSAMSTDRFYRNNGDGTFTNISKEAGITIEGYGLGINVFDVNKDGWLDVYVSNDYLSNDLLYINKQDGTFSNEISSYLKHQSHSSMGCDIADINNDGLPDIVTLEMLPNDMTRRKRMWGSSSYSKTRNNERLNYEFQYMRNMLQVNQGHGPNNEVKFADISLYAGIHATEWSWAALFNDYDADGNKDLFISNGFPKDITDMDFMAYKSNTNLASNRKALLDALPESKVRNFFYKNKGELQFEEVSEAWGIEEKSFSNGAAYGDLDNDGDLDLVINNINDNASFLINQSENINYLQIELEDEVGASKAIGASVDVYIGNQIQSQHFAPVRGYISSVQPMLFYGLGASTKVDSIRITWSDGKSQLEPAAQANQKLLIKYKGEDSNRRLKSSSLFNDISGILEYKHRESEFVDFNIQALLPRQYSLMGPAISVGDIDNNGEEDLLIGGSSINPGSIFYAKNGSYEKKPLETMDLVLRQEDVGTLLFDADNDKDLDLYVVSGGYESEAQTVDYQDRIYVNDGKGKFSNAYKAIPELKTSGSIVKGADFDKDGDIDLFVGGRIMPKAYPSAVSSFLLRNDFRGKDNPRFTDISAEHAPDFTDLGMVTDATWADFDLDGWMDLVLVGEWMSPRFFRNNQGKFEDVSEQAGLTDKVGWWSSLTSGDFDNDGDIDFIAGNLGTNSYYQASDSIPLHIFSHDFDQNGGHDCFMASSQGYDDGKLYPIHPWDDLLKQMQFLKKKVVKYEDYANSSIDKLFSPDQLSSAKVYKANYFESSYFENLGNGKFSSKKLPISAQLAPIQAMNPIDLNEDGFLDVMLVGNDFGGELFSGRYDALNGLILYGDGKGGFNAKNYSETGFLVEGDARTLVSFPDKSGKLRLMSTQNRKTVKIYETKEDRKAIPLDLLDTWAVLELADGSKRRIELGYGGSGISQSSRHIILPYKFLSLNIYSSDGSIRLKVAGN